MYYFEVGERLTFTSALAAGWAHQRRAWGFYCWAIRYGIGEWWRERHEDAE